MLDLYFHEFFEWGLVQTDPNWANFLIDDRREQLNLVLLDFGASRRYTREFIKKYVRLLKLAAAMDFSSLIDHSIDFGLIDRRESKDAHRAFAELLETAIRPFFSTRNGSKHFDFSDQSHALNSNFAAKALSNELVFSPPPYSLVFLHRKLAGVYSILKSLGVQLDVSTYWQKMEDYSEN